jgi:chorismate mutase
MQQGLWRYVLLSLISPLYASQEIALSSSVSAPIVVEEEIVEKIDGVLFTIQEWFALTHELAKWKWNHEAPIQDKKKEDKLIQVLCEKGEKAGLQPQLVKEIFQAQLEASRMIQENHFENWRKQEINQFGGVLNFKTDLRPKIERLCDQFILKLKEALPLLRKRNLSDVIKWRAEIVISNDEAVNDSVKDVALQPLIMLSAQISMK